MCLIIDRSIICVEIKSARQKVSELLAGPINSPGFSGHRINNNHLGKKKIQAILSKVRGQTIIRAKGK